jgi:transposase
MEQNDDIRLKEFRQLKREIRGSRTHLVVGMDIAKEKHHAFFGIPGGKTLYRGLSFPNTKEGFDHLLFHADTLKKQYQLEKVVFGLEPTADYHKPLAEYLIREGHMVVLVAGTAVKRNRELLDGRWDKNDTKDAANVADLISQGKCLFYDLPLADIRDLRGLLSLRRRLKRLEHASRVRIRNHLIAQHFPEMDDYFSYSEGPSIVRWCFNPKEITTLSFEEFSRMVSSCRNGKQLIRLREIYTKAGSSIGCEVTPGVPHEAKTLLDQLQMFHEMTKETEVKIVDICTRFPEYPPLLSIPGFGPDISSKVLGAIGNPYRFENESQVLKLAGLDLSKNQSGKVDGIPVISKKGKADLRYGLYQAALVASSLNHHFIRYFTKKLHGREREKGIKTKMRIKLSAKMLVIAWTLMKKKERFDPGYLKD